MDRVSKWQNTVSFMQSLGMPDGWELHSRHISTFRLRLFGKFAPQT
jgi:hypothetical protein